MTRKTRCGEQLTIKRDLPRVASHCSRRYYMCICAYYVHALCMHVLCAYALCIPADCAHEYTTTSLHSCAHFAYRRPAMLSGSAALARACGCWHVATTHVDLMVELGWWRSISPAASCASLGVVAPKYGHHPGREMSTQREHKLRWSTCLAWTSDAGMRRAEPSPRPSRQSESARATVQHSKGR